MVYRDACAFNLEVIYEWLPDFSFHCRIIGHDVIVCRWLQSLKVVEKVDRCKHLAQVQK